MRMLAFAKRNAKEIIRDPLNLAFGLVFPLVLILLLSAIQANIPVALFEIAHLAPGVTVFGLSFMTLFSATLIAKDRGGALLWRLYTTPMKPLDFIRIPVLVEDAVLTEDIEYEGQIVAHSGDTVATAGTILAETDLYNVAAYGHETYGKNRVIFTFVYSGDCSWNSEQQKVIVNEGPGLDAYGDLQNLHRVAVEGEPEDYYISATMDYNGTLYRGSWKQHDRYTRWITLSWEPIMNYWVGTQAQYNALAPNYDNNTLYIIIN